MVEDPRKAVPRATVVVDLDGTLCNSAHRNHLAQAKDWNEFHALLGDDGIHMDVDCVIRAMSNAGYMTIGLTGRPERYRNATLKWLLHHSVLIDELLMRPDENFESDKVVKPRLLAQYFGSMPEALDNVLVILDDRDHVVEEWRNLGFCCWQVRPGDY